MADGDMLYLLPNHRGDPGGDLRLEFNNRLLAVVTFLTAATTTCISGTPTVQPFATDM